jgi:restriction system protein
MARRGAARRHAQQKRKLSKLLERGVAAFAIGLALIAFPSFAHTPVLQSLASGLQPLGGVAMLMGAVLIGMHLLMRRRQPAQAPLDIPAPSHRPATARRRQTEPHVDPLMADTEVAVAAHAEPPDTTYAGTVPPERPTAWSVEVFNVIEWRRFEAVCERLFAQAGFETKSQSHGADEGIDIWLYSKTQPDAPVSLVQCKCWNTRAVKVDEVRALLGSMAAKKVQRGVFATTSRFTTEAAKFGKENGIHLLDGTGLLDLIGKRMPEQQAELLAVATEGEYWVPTCASCGVKLLRRTPKLGGKAFWGCRNFSKGCRVTINGA